MNRLILILLAYAPVLWAGEAERLLKQVRLQFESRGLWELTFEQQMLPSAGGRDTLRAVGRLLACPTGAFRVDMDGLHVLSDGDRLWRWEDGGSQVLLESPDQSEDILLPHQLLIFVEEKFRPTSIRAEGAKGRVIRLQPRSASEFIRQVDMRLTLDGNQWWPRDISYTDFSDSRMRFLVLKRKSWADRAARQQEFVFRLPVGMELIDLRAGAADATR